jgi:hypothetical protein
MAVKLKASLAWDEGLKQGLRLMSGLAATSGAGENPGAASKASGVSVETAIAALR